MLYKSLLINNNNNNKWGEWMIIIGWMKRWIILWMKWCEKNIFNNTSYCMSTMSFTKHDHYRLKFTRCRCFGKANTTLRLNLLHRNTHFENLFIATQQKNIINTLIVYKSICPKCHHAHPFEKYYEKSMLLNCFSSFIDIYC